MFIGLIARTSETLGNQLNLRLLIKNTNSCRYILLNRNVFYIPPKKSIIAFKFSEKLHFGNIASPAQAPFCYGPDILEKDQCVKINVQ